ncbi:hypothetical protein LPB67_15970 [Undibacterium sp. Jales W-56]|uniref:hypothetical protein n=1 Tax=Undibacterium sp. Jales W-56 TaxID=2897325 RepID=UPI0021CF2942|nr:hypothetical protein [Undibacterium sp. Jales W-56]MCU6435273.1 hypothetical protein [Undibacterium sp. Jales W-56]
MNEAKGCAATKSGASPAPFPEQRMNSGCYCVSLNRDALRQALEAQLGSPALVALVEDRCPFLFSAMPVFVSESQHQQMEAVVKALEFVIGMSSYRERILSSAAPIARHDPGGAGGVFFGYDFHLVGDAIGLIEINTNAGGAMLNAVMARAHRACTINADQLATAAESGPRFEAAIMDMFLAEWERCKRGRQLRSIAIVDTAPESQYLYPEFILFKQLFERHGVRAVIADPTSLRFHDGTLWHGNEPIDLVYNRLTDFMLDDVRHDELRQAYLDGAVVLTPHPQAHALYADKRNLGILSSRVELKSLGVPKSVQEILLAFVLPTELVIPGDADRLWQSRRKLFFKPASGYGGRAAYRGDKLTKGVWQDILGGQYVAQQVMAPGERVAGSRNAPEKLKFDLRMYAYANQVQWTAARVYQGQTTNFRTPGGGFAPVYHVAQTA